MRLKIFQVSHYNGSNLWTVTRLKRPSFEPLPAIPDFSGFVLWRGGGQGQKANEIRLGNGMSKRGRNGKENRERQIKAEELFGDIWYFCRMCVT